MRRILELIMTHIFIFLLILLGIKGYKEYKRLKIKHILNVWKKKYQPFSIKKEA